MWHGDAICSRLIGNLYMFIHRYHGHGIVDDATSEAPRDMIACSKWRKTPHKPNLNGDRRWGPYRLEVATRMAPRAPNNGYFGPYLTLTGERSPSLLELFGVHPAKSKAAPRCTPDSNTRIIIRTYHRQCTNGSGFIGGKQNGYATKQDRKTNMKNVSLHPYQFLHPL